MAKHSDSMSGLEHAIVREVAKTFFVAGHEVQVEAQLSITNGAVSGKNHVPSRPGEPPKNDTATLANGIETVQLSPLHVEISSNAPHSAALEHGTSKMAARPFMLPAAIKARPQIKKMVLAAVRRAVRNHGR